MTLIEDAATTKLHVDADNHVWYTDLGGLPCNSGQTIDEFLSSSPHCSGPRRIVRLIGTPQNAELISTLYVRQRQKEISRVQIAGPNVCENATELADPSLAILRMRQALTAPACGGWHDLSEYEYPAYAMLARLQRNHGVVDDLVRTYLKVHPAYRAVTFIPDVAEEHLARLLATIVDPRWYVDRRAPEKTTKLALFLGLVPAVQARVSDATIIVTKKRDLRCATVLNCWKTMPADRVNMSDPRNFLWRIWRACGGGVRADLRASQAFIRYVCYNWLDVLDRRKGYKDGLFAPDLFFKTAEERKSYLQHMSREL